MSQDFQQGGPGSFGQETRIQSDHLCAEGYLIDNALTGAVSAGKQFEVFNPIVPAVPVDVVDGFFAGERSADVLLHDPSVFQNIPERRLSRSHRDTQFDVAMLSSRPRNPLVRVTLLMALKTEKAAAFCATDAPPTPLRSSNSSIRCFEPLSRAFLAADYTGLSFAFPFALPSAGARAIKRVATKYAPVVSDVAWHVAERLPAFLAGKVQHLWSLVCRAMDRNVIPVASLAAEAAVCVSRSDRKGRGTLLAGFLDRHRGVSMFVQRYVYRHPDAASTTIVAGA